MSALKVNKDVTFSIFGCCVTQDICSDFKHIRAAGLTNWISIASGRVSDNTINMSQLDDIDICNYRKRNVLLECNGDFLEYLLENKADYLIIDLSDNRLQLLATDNCSDLTNNSCITYSSDNCVGGLFGRIRALYSMNYASEGGSIDYLSQQS